MVGVINAGLLKVLPGGEYGVAVIAHVRSSALFATRDRELQNIRFRTPQQKPSLGRI